MDGKRELELTKRYFVYNCKHFVLKAKPKVSFTWSAWKHVEIDMFGDGTHAYTIYNRRSLYALVRMFLGHVITQK